jgi:hypothetical protein
MRYTKGNWYVSGNKVGPRIVSDDQDDGMMMPVCYIETFDYPDQHEANAKLIASAPALLEALEEITESYIKIIDEEFDGSTIAEVFRAKAKKAKAAIQQAKAVY